jgi:toxin-antitoxin system PIN domain toxin
MFVVDTNILVYAANQDAAEHRRCRDLVESWRRGSLPWFTTWSVLYEFLRVVSHPRVFDRPWPLKQAWRFVAALLSSPGHQVLAATRRHVEVAAQTFGELPDIHGNLIHDAQTAILMREHGIRRIFTRDTDFHRFPFLEVVDPLRDAPAG